MGDGEAARPDLVLPTWRDLARRMVEGLGPVDPEIASALSEVPRHVFLGPRYLGDAYEDTPLPVGPEATISAPHMVALQLEWAELAPGLRVLEVGSGCGYLLALLDRLVGAEGAVRGVEIEPGLAETSRRNLQMAGARPSVAVRTANGAEGWAEEGPFDRAIVSYAASALAPAWGAQLVEGGLLVLPRLRAGGTFLERLCKRKGQLETDRRGPPCLFVASKSEPLERW